MTWHAENDVGNVEGIKHLYVINRISLGNIVITEMQVAVVCLASF